jgi:type I restriction enzyme S subunit
VPQDSNDEPASILIERIRGDKEKLIQEKKLKKEKKYQQAEVVFQVPASWTFARIGELAIKMGAGSTPKGGKDVYSEVGVPFVRSQNILHGSTDLSDVVFVSDKIDSEMKSSRIYNGDLLVNLTGASLGRCAVLENLKAHANVNQHVCAIRFSNDYKELSKYISTVLLSSYGQDLIFSSARGAGRPAIAKEQLELFEIPLPPLNEIKRINSKCEEGMATVSMIEAELDSKQMLVTKLKQSILKSAFEGKL